MDRSPLASVFAGAPQGPTFPPNSTGSKFA
jgi:hypothetical protein